MAGLTDEQIVGFGNPTLLLETGQSGTLVNYDIANTVWISTVPAFLATDGQGIAELGPLNSMSFDGTTPIYGVTSALNIKVKVLILPYATQWQPSPAQSAAQINALGLATVAAQNTQIGQLTTVPGNTIGQEVAAQIATGSAAGTPGGTPLLHGTNVITNPASAGLVIAAATTTNSGFLTLTKPGYFVRIAAKIANTATNPFVTIKFQWYEPTDTFAVGLEEWTIPASTNGTYIHVGKGTTKGASLNIQWSNLDPAVSVTLTVTLIQTTQHVGRDDLRAISTDVLAVYTTAITAEPATNLLCGEINGSLITGNSAKFLVPLYCGDVDWTFSATQSLLWQLLGPSSLASPLGGAVYLSESGTTFNPTKITHPRFPLELVLTNTSGSTATYQAVGVPVEYAS